MGVCASAPRTTDIQTRDEDKVFTKNKSRAIRVETSALPESPQINWTSDDQSTGQSNASFLIKSEGKETSTSPKNSLHTISLTLQKVLHLFAVLSSLCLADQSKISFDASERTPTSQDSAISSNLSIATSIQERRGDGNSLTTAGSNERRQSVESAEGESCAREGSTIKGCSNASSLATVVEEPVEGRHPAMSMSIAGQGHATEAVRATEPAERNGSRYSPLSTKSAEDGTEAQSTHTEGLHLPDSASIGKDGAVPPAINHGREESTEPELPGSTKRHPRGSSSVALAIWKAVEISRAAPSAGQPFQEGNADPAEFEHVPSTLRGA